MSRNVPDGWEVPVMRWIPFILALTLVASASAEIPARRAAIDAYVADADRRAAEAYAAGEYAAAAAVYEAMRAEVDLELVPDQAPGILYNLACCHALEGEREAALDALDAAVESGWRNAAHLARDTDLDSVRDDPRFRAISERLDRDASLAERTYGSPAIETPYRPVLPVEERIAGLSRLWSEAIFAFAYFDQVPDLDWHAEYVAALPRVMAAERTIDYYRVLAEVIATLHDGHSSITYPKEIGDRVYARPRLETALIEGRVVITRVLDDAIRDVSVGDEIVTIAGIPTEVYVARYVSPAIAASTPQDRETRTYTYELLRGSVDQPVRLGVAGASGRVREVELPRTFGDGSGDPHVEWRRLAGDVGYVAINTFNSSDVDSLVREAMTSLASASGLVIDIRRNGGGSSGWWVMRHLVDSCETSAWSSRRYVPVYRAWGRGENVVEGPPGVVTAGPSDVRVSGPVVLLIGPRTYSAAEDFAVAFDYSGRGTLVGRATGGSTGQPLSFPLPGGGFARVCGKRDTYPDGTVFVGRGVQPDVEVLPTVGDIRTGIDRALERAREIVLGSG